MVIFLYEFAADFGNESQVGYRSVIFQLVFMKICFFK